jgi:dCTP deaminase
MILSDGEINFYGDRLIQPFAPENVQPSSIDVRLGNDFKIFQRDSTTHIDFADPVDITKHIHIDDDEYFLMHPGEFALGVTAEVLTIPSNLVAALHGKSSVGRLGLMIHVTAGYIDAGFNGPVTLEMYSLHPLPAKLRPKMKIAQISFQRMSQPAINPYNGRYQFATGVESSKYSMQDGLVG